ncbi:hypothetical protein [Microbacterium sp. BLY]|uniref:hypothetical protein n=1 Tax=Microbacterium sp. BLY TaxID=2823280 RepID=UPI0027DCB010|nr:hypothetical protein [Microbacterium sp. BLY]
MDQARLTHDLRERLDPRPRGRRHRTGWPRRLRRHDGPEPGGVHRRDGRRRPGLPGHRRSLAEATEHVFLAREIERVEDAVDSRAEEGIDTVEWVAFSEVLRMIADGRITEGETIAAIALAGIRLGMFR